MYPTDFLYSEDHEWIKVEDGICTLGITNYAQEELGEVVFVDLPDVGSVFDAGDEIGTIESVKAVAEVYTPVAGEIVEVNGDLEDAPEIVNEDPHGDGWLVKVKFSSDSDFKRLLKSDAYEQFLESGE